MKGVIVKVLNIFFILLLSVSLLTTTSFSQDKEPRKSPKSSVSQVIGIDTEITFDFSRPSVRERVIWGEVVPWGFEPGNKYSDNKPFPWRGGANESTTLSCSKAIVIGGQSLPAGKYSLHGLRYRWRQT